MGPIRPFFLHLPPATQRDQLPRTMPPRIGIPGHPHSFTGVPGPLGMRRHSYFSPPVQQVHPWATRLDHGLTQPAEVLHRPAIRQALAHVQRGTLPFDAAMDLLARGMDLQCGQVIPDDHKFVAVRSADCLVEPLPDGIAGDTNALRDLRAMVHTLPRPDLAWSVVEIRCAVRAYSRVHLLSLDFLMARIQNMLGGHFRLSCLDPRTCQMTVRLPGPRLARTMARLTFDSHTFDWDFVPGEVSERALIRSHERDHQVMAMPLRSIHLADIGGPVHPALYRVHEMEHGFQFFALPAPLRVGITTLLTWGRSCAAFRGLSEEVRGAFTENLLEPAAGQQRGTDLYAAALRALHADPRRQPELARHHLTFVRELQRVIDPTTLHPMDTRIITRELEELASALHLPSAASSSYA